MPDIILNTYFTIPGIGFHDEFDRVDGPLGETLDGKAWARFQIGSGVDVVIAGNAAQTTAVTGTSVYRAADAGSQTIEVESTIETAGNGAGGFVLATAAWDNALRVRFRAPAAGNRISVERYRGTPNEDVFNAPAGTPLVNDGDTVRATWDGEGLSVYVNDVMAINHWQPANRSGLGRFAGLYGAAGGIPIRWANIIARAL